MKKLTLFPLITIFLLVFCQVSYSQITIAPTNIFVSNNSRFATYLVINNSDIPQELSIDFFFGYSKTFPDGQRKVIQEDSVLATQFSIAEFMRAFPRNFTLQPNQRQTVRIRINYPTDLQDGMYWARIMTESRPESPPIEITTEDAVTARVGITIQQVSGIFLKIGDPKTGIEVERINTSINKAAKTMTVLSDFKRLGNSPFLGTITTTLRSQNEIVSERLQATTLYFDGTHKEELNISDLAPGKYTVHVHFETKRSDISPSDLVQMEPVTATTTVTIP